MGTGTHHIQRKFRSDKFDSEDISSLSLFLYESLFVIISHDKTDETISAVNLYTLQGDGDIGDLIGTDELINAPNTTGKLYSHHQGFTLVPGMVFNPAHSEIYLSFATEVDPLVHEITYVGVGNNTIQVLGTVQRSLLESLDSKLPELEIAHGAAHVLDFFLHQAKDLLPQEIFIHTAPNSVYVAGFKAGELALFNRFLVPEESALLRYLFTILQQLAFDQAHCRISIYGNLNWVHSSMDDLKRFFRNIHSVTPTQKITYKKGAEPFKNTLLLEAYWR
ncbi:DUF3822 family protein [Cyclobacterium xiamenense]|uniref:DUF3822 family protein n=1 Tax=Cyclobacterium xiamenense TaxID=1297121 RepID=UPI0035CEB22C